MCFLVKLPYRALHISKRRPSASLLGAFSIQRLDCALAQHGPFILLFFSLALDFCLFLMAIFSQSLRIMSCAAKTPCFLESFSSTSLHCSRYNVENKAGQNGYYGISMLKGMGKTFAAVVAG